jgi:Tol biopolymer transport system component
MQRLPRAGRLSSSRVAGLLALALCLLLPGSVNAAFPGANGKIAFVNKRNFTPQTGWQQVDVWTINPDGSGATNLTNGAGKNSGPEWSPDGKRIVFYSDRDGNNEIYVMNADGSAPTRLTNDPLDDRTPSWSPDGQKIVFSSTRGDGQTPYYNWDIYTMNPDGSNVARLIDFPSFALWPVWSPKGDKIVFTGEPPSQYPYDELYSANADGSGVTPLSGFDAEVDSTEPDWSPDARKIAWAEEYGYSNNTGNCGYEIGCIAVAVMNADGTNPVRLTGGDYNRSPAWSPDGTKIAYNRNVQALMTMNADGTGGTTILPRATGEGNEDLDWQPLIPFCAAGRGAQGHGGCRSRGGH